MTVASAANKVTLNGNGSTTSWPFSFRIFDASDLEIYKTDTDGVQTEITSNFSVVVNGESGGTVTYPSAGSPLASGETITIIRVTVRAQSIDFTSQGAFLAQNHEDADDRSMMILQELEEKVDRSFKLPVSDTSGTATELTTDVAGSDGGVLYIQAGVLKLSESADIDNLETLAGISGDISTVAANDANITIVATNLDGSDTIGTVAGSIANVNNVGDNIASVLAVDGNASNINAAVANATNINTVAGISSDVTTVSGISADVTTVAADGADIGTVAGISADVATVAGISSNVTTVATDTAAVNAVASDLTGDDDIGTVATNIANVNAVVSNISDITSAVSQAAAGVQRNTATGDNSTTTFALPSTPWADEVVFAYLDGVMQDDSEWSISGSDITFSTAPGTGVNIELVVLTAGTVTSAQTAATNAAASEVAAAASAATATASEKGFAQVDTVAALKALGASGVSSGDIYYLRGYNAVGDNGAGELRALTGSATSNGLTADDGMVFENTAADLTFVRQLPDNRVTPYHYGATADGTADDNDAVEAAFDYVQSKLDNSGNNDPVGDAILYIPAGEFTSTSGLELLVKKSGMQIEGDGFISILKNIAINVSASYARISGVARTGGLVYYGINLGRDNDVDSDYSVLEDIHIDGADGIVIGLIQSCQATRTRRTRLHIENCYVSELAYEGADSTCSESSYRNAAHTNLMICGGNQYKGVNNSYTGANECANLFLWGDRANDVVECYWTQCTITGGDLGRSLTITDIRYNGTGDEVKVTTSAAHRFASNFGDSIRISDTTNYDGTYSVTGVVSTTEFTVDISGSSGYATESSGTVDAPTWDLLAHATNDTPLSVASITKGASNTALEVTTHGLSTGDKIVTVEPTQASGDPFTSGGKIRELHTRIWRVSVIDADNFYIQHPDDNSAVDSSGWSNSDVSTLDVKVLPGVESDTGYSILNVNDMFFTGGNINHALIKSGTNINFTGTRLKQNIWMIDGQVNRIMFRDQSKGRGSSNNADILFGGATTGWTRIATTQDVDATAPGDGGLRMSVPNKDTALDSKGMPSLNTFTVYEDEIQLEIAGSLVHAWDDNGTRFERLAMGSNVTISSGVADVTGLRRIRLVAESGGVDDLDGFTGGVDNQVLSVEAANSSAITIKDNMTPASGDKIQCPNSTDYLLPGGVNERIEFIYTNAQWRPYSASE